MDVTQTQRLLCSLGKRTDFRLQRVVYTLTRKISKNPRSATPETGNK